VTQRFDIAALGAPWLPAAWRPDAVDAPEAVRYHPESGTLMVDTEVPTADGFTYGVRSAVADLDAESLRSATVDGGVGLDDVYLSLPDDLSPVVARVARDVTTGATTPYDQARALQDYFAVNFTYDLDVPPGHGGDAIEAFLERGSGYCEQFAGTYAAMARTLGIPARVAVGFSPGDPDPDNPGTWVVRGRHAHAWAEVWLGEFGWVPMEPTPGRGAPGAEAWTGRPEQQAGSEVGGGPAETLPAVPTTAAGSGPSPGDPGGEAQPVAPGAPAPPGADVPGEVTGPGGVVAAVAVAAAVALAALGAWVAVVAWWRRRGAPGGSTSERVGVAWRSVLDSLGASGLRRGRTETAPAFTRRVGAVHPDVAGPLETVSAAADRARFACDPPDEATAVTAEVSAATVVATLGAQRRGLARLRPLLVPPRRHRSGV
jgi:transglutaminase-like putative cysteine protease